MVDRALARGGAPLPPGVRGHFARSLGDAHTGGNEDSRPRPFGGWLVGRSDSPAEVRAIEAAGRAGRPSADAHPGRTGEEFDSVRVHDDEPAARAANALGARAFSLGEDIFFAAGQYRPSSSGGRELIGHELAHVLQARESRPVIMRQGSDVIDTTTPEYLRGYNDGRANNPSNPGPLSSQGMAEYDAGHARGLAEAAQAQKSFPRVEALPELEPQVSRPPLAMRLQVIEESGAATQARLDQIIRTGGPMPDTKNGAKVVGAAIIDVEGYTGPKEMRAVNGADTDALGVGAPVYHAKSPTTRSLSATQGVPTAKGGRQASILGPRRESIFPHLNDAEMKIFEDIIPRLPPGAKGTISFTTVRIAKGQTVPEPYPACSGCIRASFETAGMAQGVDLVSHAPTYTPLSADPMSVPHEGATEHEHPPVPTGKSGTTTEIEQPGAPGSRQKGTGVPSQSGGGSGLAIELGTGVATVGMDWLAAYLKSKVDAKIAARQIEAFLALAKNKINVNPDGALKKMMLDPYRTVYAWVYLESSVITTLGLDPWGSPSMSSSSPLIDLSRIDYEVIPFDPALLGGPPLTISGGAPSLTVTTPIVIDIPLTTPPLETLIGYAKARNLPTDDLYAFASARHQRALESSVTAFETNAKTWQAYQTTNETFKKLQAAFEAAKRRNDHESMHTLSESMLKVSESLLSITGQMGPVREGIEKADKDVKYWEHIQALTRPTHP